MLSTRRCVEGRDTVLRRLIDDPLVARRTGWRALMLALVLVAMGQVFDDLIGGLALASAWIVAPVIALAIGYGEAFFLQHGRNRKRVLVMIVVGMLVAVAACVVLSVVATGDDEAGLWVNLAGSLVLYGGVTVGLSGLVGIGIGRGSGYVAGKIDEMSRDDW